MNATKINQIKVLLLIAIILIAIFRDKIGDYTLRAERYSVRAVGKEVSIFIFI